jgi:hypothetical protein
VAEDGVAAVGKMTHQKYDIVLMVRWLFFFFFFWCTLFSIQSILHSF